MQRFFLSSSVIKNGVVEIHDPRIVFQANKVLRMKADDRFSIFDSDGKEMLVEVLELDRKKLSATVIEEIKRDTEPELNVVLYQAIPKKPALLELVIQKATEIGVSEIYPLITKRTEKQRLGKLDRLQMIALEATEQCRRTHVPTVHEPIDFKAAIEQADDAYMAYENEDKKTLHDFIPSIHKAKKVAIFIGPEGGFDQSEVDLATANNAKLFSLGKRILRTETAAISALSIVLL